MKKSLLSVLLLGLTFGLQAQTDLKSDLKAKQVTLPNGWKLSPHGSSISLGDLPLHVAVSPNQKYLLVTNNGQSIQSLQLINATTNQVLDSKKLAKSWYGLKVAEDNQTVYVSGGNDNCILVFDIAGGKLVEKEKIALSTDPKANISPAGIELDEAKGLLYVVTKENNSLYVIDLKSKAIRSIHPLPAEAFTCLLDKKKG
ncbi:MAG: YncE family protein, partial [Aquirufa sp.]